MRPSGADGEVNQLFPADVSFQSAIHSDGGVAPYVADNKKRLPYEVLPKEDVKFTYTSDRMRDMRELFPRGTQREMQLRKLRRVLRNRLSSL